MFGTLLKKFITLTVLHNFYRDKLATINRYLTRPAAKITEARFYRLLHYATVKGRLAVSGTNCLKYGANCILRSLHGSVKSKLRQNTSPRISTAIVPPYFSTTVFMESMP